MAKNKSRGLTLLEIIVTVSIMTFFLGMSFKLYSDFNFNKALESVTKQLVELLELAKKKASTGDKTNIPVDCTLSGYKISYSSSTYELKALCPNVVSIGASYKLAEGFTLSGDGSGEIVIKPFGLGANQGCIIVNGKTGTCRKITVDATASITYGSETSSCICP